MASAKWIGGFLGLLGGGPFGAIAGYVLGAWLENSFKSSSYTSVVDNDDRSSSMDSDPTSGSYTSSYTKAEGERNGFLFSLMLLSSQVIQADGKIMHSEMECVRKMLRNTFGEVAVSQGDQLLKILFERRKMQGEALWQQQLSQACTQIAGVMSLEQRLQLLQFLCQIAKADGNVDPSEVVVLKRIAHLIDVEDQHVIQLLNLGGTTLEQAYKVLGISPDATDDEVKKAYRKMALQHHPDKVASLGEDIRKAAEQKFKEIGEAKELIFKARGL